MRSAFRAFLSYFFLGQRVGERRVRGVRGRRPKGPGEARHRVRNQRRVCRQRREILLLLLSF